MIDKINEEINHLLLKKSNSNLNYEEEKQLDLEIFNLIEKRIKLIDEIFIETHTPDLSDNEINLYIKDSCKKLEFLIYSKHAKQYIGSIKYYEDLEEDKTKIGNISYFIKEEYRGHNYALKALKLLADKLYDDGIKEIFIAAYKNNIPSIKTIQKFGGVEIPSIDEKIVVYKCDLTLIKSKKASR